MDIFYFILFGAVGMFNILAAVLDWKWYIDSVARQWGMGQNGRPGGRVFVRVVIGLFGAVLTAFGTAVLVGWL
ncbi:MAG: hypothetical protein J1F11_08485 [Oscillospiraceae bacterium]|nr:hypothetical protein [Oscillospiraceae bacterium]